MVYNDFMVNNDLNFFFYDLETSGLKAKDGFGAKSDWWADKYTGEAGA